MRHIDYILHVDDVKFYRKSSSRNALKIRGRTGNSVVGAAESQHSQMIINRSGFGASGIAKAVPLWYLCPSLKPRKYHGEDPGNVEHAHLYFCLSIYHVCVYTYVFIYT